MKQQCLVWMHVLKLGYQVLCLVVHVLLSAIHHFSTHPF